jgi:multidrug transporter EmrE-like cation transporter
VPPTTSRTQEAPLGRPGGASYPVWAGVGTVGALAAAYALFGERLVVGQWIGVALVLLGVVLINAPQLLGRNA